MLNIIEETNSYVSSMKKMKPIEKICIRFLMDIQHAAEVLEISVHMKVEKY